MLMTAEQLVLGTLSLLGSLGTAAAFAKYKKVKHDLESERKKSQIALRNSSLMEALIDNSSDFIGIADERGTPLYLNPAGRQLVGLSPKDDISATKIPDYYPEDQQDLVLNEIVPQMMSSGQWNGETKFKNFRTQESIPVSDKHFIIKSPENGTTIGMGTITRDLREKLAGEKARAESQSKSEILAALSHEIRTPVSVILGYSQWLLCDEHSRTLDDYKQVTQKIVKTSENLIRLLEQMLESAKLDSGATQLHCRIIDFPEFLMDYQQRGLADCTSKGIGWTFRVLNKIPLQIETDDIRLAQILNNLVRNAIKFTLQGEVKVSVDVSRNENQEALLTIDIEDTGVGMAPDEQMVIFKKFRQASAQIFDTFGGSGLGLSLSKGIAKLFGGDIILLRSAPEKGSTFRISLPIRMTEATQWVNFDRHSKEFKDHTSLQQSSVDAYGAQFPGCRILVADDLEMLRLLTRLFLERLGVTVQLATNGREACQMALTQPFDLVLMDLNMPVCNGFDAMRLLKSHRPSLPIVAMTAHAHQSEKMRCMEGGFDDYLTKPVTSRRYVECLTRFYPTTADSLTVRHPERAKKLQ